MSADSRARQLDYVAEHLLTRAAVLVRLLVRQVRSREISRTDMEVLSILREAPRRITELAELEGIAQPTMTLLVKRLEDRGWVSRDRVPEDGRVVLARLTEAGKSAQHRFRGQFLAAMRSDLQDLSDEQLAALVGATDTLRAFVDGWQQREARGRPPAAS
jgi:DNA-binding MarR family transcriptional regulator